MRVRHFTVYFTLAAVAWLVNWPGRLNPDSQDMLLQARDITRLNDWHPPIVTWLWSLFTPILGQPAGALLVQALLILAYPVVVLFLRSNEEHSNTRNRLHDISGALYLMALIAATGQVIKDVMLVGFILCFLATLHVLEIRRTRTISAALLCAIFAILILLVRPTNFVLLATAAFCWAAFVLRDRRTFISAIVAIVLGCAVALPFTQFVNRTIMGAKDGLTERSLMIFDVAGISSHIQQDLFADLPDWPSAQVPRPWECYTAAWWNPFAWGKCKQYSELIANRLGRDGKGGIVRWWLSAVLRHPIAYIQHRSIYAWRFLGGSRPIVEPTRTPTADNTSDGQFDAHGFQAWKPAVAYSPFSAIADVVLSRPAFALGAISCIGLLMLTWRQRRRGEGIDTVVLIAAALGVGNILMLLPFGVADEGRYLLPTAVCGAVGMLRLFKVGSIKEEQFDYDAVDAQHSLAP